MSQVVALIQDPILRFTDNSGNPLVGGTLLTQVGGANYPTWSESTGTIQNTNPIQLNARGEIGTATGVSSPLFVSPNVAYTYTLFDAYGNLIWTAPNIISPNTTTALLAGFSQASLGAILYPITAAESTAGVTPVNYQYLPGIVDRYGNNTTPGTTDMSAAFAAAQAQQQQGAAGAPVQLLPTGYAVSSTAIELQGGTRPFVMFGVPLRSYIVNVAPAGNPTIQLIDQQTFEISGITLIGRATFPNLGIDLTSAGGQRTAYGKLTDIQCFANGVGLHLAGLNDLTIDNYAYWPGGSNSVPGAPTFDTNALIAGILADCTGIAGYNPGEVNLVTCRNINVGEVNSIANGGCAIKVDGSLSDSGPAGAAGAFSNWSVDGLDDGNSERALWLRNVSTSTFKHLYTSGEERIDQSCELIKIEELYGSAIVVDGTQSLGGCSNIHFLNAQASTITADVANSRTTHQNCYWTAAAGAGDQDASQYKAVLNSRLVAVLNADQIGNAGLCIGGSVATAQVLVNGSTIALPTNGNMARVTCAGSITGVQLAAPAVTAQARMLVVASIAGAAGSITFGTGTVASGTACIINRAVQMTFFYDSVGLLWYSS